METFVVGEQTERVERRTSDVINVFLLGYDTYQKEKLQIVSPGGDPIKFHLLLRMDELRGVDEFPVKDLLEKATEKLRSFDGDIDAIMTCVDFPAIEMVAILCERFGLQGPSLEGVMACNHKYWGRILQQEVIPTHLPEFSAFDPYDEDPGRAISHEYPFWIKPVNAYGSHLGFRINGARDFAEAILKIREGLPRISEPLRFLIDAEENNLPDNILSIGDQICIAEGIISGTQCTLEGYALNGEVEVYGVIGSVRTDNRTSFSRYEYPCRLANRVQERMIEITRKVIRHIGLDNCAFNVEYFYNTKRDHIWLLEINPRISRSHCDLFEFVDGMSHHRVALDVALGREPEMPFRRGKYKRAAKFFLRSYQDMHVKRAPSEDELQNIQRLIPGTHIETHVKECMALSELWDQDSYSFDLAWIWVGGNSHAELCAKYQECLDRLPFELEKLS